MLIKKINFPLIFILFIAAFFRFYNFREFQHWTGDDEIFTAVIRHIIWDRSPILLIPNAFLGFGLGPFFHWLAVPLYFLTNFNLVNIQAATSLLGVVTTYVIFLGASILGGVRLGLIASFLYASSFLLSLFDRRLWSLSIDSFLAAITFLILVKVIKGNVRFIPLLALPIGFSFHSDASLVVLAIAVLVSWIYFKIPLFKRYLISFFCILAIFLLPLIIAEVQYKGAVSGPIIKSMTRPLRGEGIVSSENFNFFQPSDFLNVFSKVIFTPPAKAIEEQFCYGRCDYPSTILSPFIQIAVFIVFAVSFYLSIKKKGQGKNSAIILWFMMASFIFGLFVFNRLFHANFNQYYFLVIFPIFIIILAQTLNFLTQKSKILLIVFLVIYFSSNFFSLLKSSVKYPLYKKIELVKSSLKAIGDNKFSLYTSNDPNIEGGGWTELYTLEKHPPVKSYWFGYSDWIYKAYSLFPGPIQQEDPEKIIWIQRNNEPLKESLPIIATYNYKDIVTYIFDNSDSKIN